MVRMVLIWIVQYLCQRNIKTKVIVYFIIILHSELFSARALDSILPPSHNQVNFGLSLNLDFEGEFKNDGLFYYGTKSGRDNQLKEPFRVYGREGEPCQNCGAIIIRSYQANRSTYYCPECQLRDET